MRFEALLSLSSLAICSAARLSPLRHTTLLETRPTLYARHLSQNISFEAVDIETNFVLLVDKARVVCFLYLHDISPVASSNMYSVFDLRLTCSPAKT